MARYHERTFKEEDVEILVCEAVVCGATLTRKGWGSNQYEWEKVGLIEELQKLNRYLWYAEQWEPKSTLPFPLLIMIPSHQRHQMSTRQFKFQLACLKVPKLISLHNNFCQCTVYNASYPVKSHTESLPLPLIIFGSKCLEQKSE